MSQVADRQGSDTLQTGSTDVANDNLNSFLLNSAMNPEYYQGNHFSLPQYSYLQMANKYPQGFLPHTKYGLTVGPNMSPRLGALNPYMSAVQYPAGFSKVSAGSNIIGKKPNSSNTARSPKRKASRDMQQEEAEEVMALEEEEEEDDDYNSDEDEGAGGTPHSPTGTGDLYLQGLRGEKAGAINNNATGGGGSNAAVRKSSRSTHGRWTNQEHEMFVAALKIHGKKWKKVASMIKTRTAVQIRTHAQKYFIKMGKALNGDGVSEGGIPLDLERNAAAVAAAVAGRPIASGFEKPSPKLTSGRAGSMDEEEEEEEEEEDDDGEGEGEGQSISSSHQPPRRSGGEEENGYDSDASEDNQHVLGSGGASAAAGAGMAKRSKHNGSALSRLLSASSSTGIAAEAPAGRARSFSSSGRLGQHQRVDAGAGIERGGGGGSNGIVGANYSFPPLPPISMYMSAMAMRQQQPQQTGDVHKIGEERKCQDAANDDDETWDTGKLAVTKEEMPSSTSAAAAAAATGASSSSSSFSSANSLRAGGEALSTLRSRPSSQALLEAAELLFSMAGQAGKAEEEEAAQAEKATTSAATTTTGEYTAAGSSGHAEGFPPEAGPASKKLRVDTFAAGASEGDLAERYHTLQNMPPHYLQQQQQQQQASKRAYAHSLPPSMHWPTNTSAAALYPPPPLSMPVTSSSSSSQQHAAALHAAAVAATWSPKSMSEGALGRAGAMGTMGAGGYHNPFHPFHSAALRMQQQQAGVSGRGGGGRNGTTKKAESDASSDPGGPPSSYNFSLSGSSGEFESGSSYNGGANYYSSGSASDDTGSLYEGTRPPPSLLNLNHSAIPPYHHHRRKFGSGSRNNSSNSLLSSDGGGKQGKGGNSATSGNGTKKYRYLTFNEKYGIIQRMKQCEMMSGRQHGMQAEIAREYNVSQSTVYQILKKRDEIEFYCENEQKSAAAAAAAVGGGAGVDGAVSLYHGGHSSSGNLQEVNSHNHASSSSSSSSSDSTNPNSSADLLNTSATAVKILEFEQTLAQLLARQKIDTVTEFKSFAEWYASHLNIKDGTGLPWQCTPEWMEHFNSKCKDISFLK